MGPELRLLFQPPNGVGLGHISRLSAIATAFLARYPMSRVLFATTPKGAVILDRYGLPSLPSPQSLNSPTWAEWPPPELNELKREMANLAIHSFAPQAVVFDCFPSAAMFSTAQKTGIPIAMVLREIKDWGSYLAHHRRYLDACRLIVVPHTSDEFRLPPEYDHKAHYVGPIGRTMEPRAELDDPFPSRPAIAICAGGGGGEGVLDFFRVSMTAFDLVRRVHPTASAIVVTGPLFSNWYDLPLVDRARIVPFDPYIERLYFHADLTISQCGYNTMVELETLGVPAVCLPAPRPVDIQTIRAERMAGRSEFLSFYKGADPSELADIVCRRIANGPRLARNPVQTDGADLAAQALRTIVG